MHFKQTTPLPPFFPLPHFLLTRPLTTNAKLLYALLLARTQLSQRNGWVDETGSVYVIYTLRQMADALRCSVRSVSSALCELEREGLLTRTRRGWNQANRIYLLLPETPCSNNFHMDTQDSSTPDVQASSIYDAQEASTPYSKNCHTDTQDSSTPDVREASAPYSRNFYMDRQEASDHEGQNLPPNKKERDNRYTQKREIQARLTYGKYRNVFLCADELALLREHYPKDYLEAIDDLSCRIVRDGDRYGDHCAQLLRSLRLLDELRGVTSPDLSTPPANPA